MIEFLLPRTDAGVAARLAILLAAAGTTLVLLRRRRHLLLLATGVTLLALGLLGVRAVH